MALICVFVVLRGLYIENDPIGKIIFTAVLFPAFWALILKCGKLFCKS
jgi:hypothetical protein